MSDTAIKFIVPRDAKGVLKWVFIDGEGKENLSGVKKYTAQVALTPEQAKPYIESIDAFWEVNKVECKYTKADEKQNPAHKAGTPKPPASMGYKEDDDGNFVFTFSTNTTYQDGTPKVIDIYNAKATKVNLGGKKIGNGSLGALSGIMDVYDKANNAGVALYLNAIQLFKFVEFSTDAGFEAADSDEGGFTGIDSSMNDFEPVAESDTPAKPRL